MIILTVITKNSDLESKFSVLPFSFASELLFGERNHLKTRKKIRNDEIKKEKKNVPSRLPIYGVNNFFTVA